MHFNCSVLKKWISRFLGVMILLFGVTFLSFSIMHLAPGDPAEAILMANGGMPTEQEIIEKRIELGLDRPFIEQYGSWVKDLMYGDFGDSMKNGDPIGPRLLRGLKYSSVLAVCSLLFGLAIAFPVGVFAAVKKDKVFDKVTCVIIFLRLSAPSFLVGLGLLYVFAYKLKLVSISARNSGVAGMILPMITLGTGVAVGLIRQIRMLIIQEMSSFYVTGIRSRGVSENKILFGHVLKNAMLPIITLIAERFGGLIGGTAITEIIFSWPGLGQMVTTAINDRDYIFVQGFVVVTSLIFCIIYSLTEMSYSLFDPRVKYAERDKDK